MRVCIGLSTYGRHSARRMRPRHHRKRDVVVRACTWISSNKKRRSERLQQAEPAEHHLDTVSGMCVCA